MSHIPASAMPHAAPHHHDPEQPLREEATTTQLDTTAATETSVKQPEQSARPTPAAKPARSGWAIAALAVGGVALAATAVGVPLLRRDGSAAKRKDGKA